MESHFDRNRIKDHFDRIAQFQPSRGEDLSQISYLHHVRLQKTNDFLGAVNELKILDIGCGPGLAAEYIVKNGGRYFGIDLSGEVLKKCNQSSSNEESMNLAAGIMEHLPFPDATFDGVLCLGVLEYVADLEMAVSELARVTRPGSIVIMSMQNKFSIYRWWDRHVYSGYLFNMLRRFRRRPIAGQPLERATTFKDLKDILSRHRFVVQDFVYYNFNLWIMPLDSWFPNLSIQISKKFEFLTQSALGFLLGADFLIKAQGLHSDVKTILNSLL